MKRNFKPKSMKNTLKLIVAASIVAIAASCGAKNESSENTDTVTVETPAPAPAVEADTTVVVDSTAVN
jgi:hypothetical protein